MHVFWTKAITLLWGDARQDQAPLDLPLRYQHHLNAVTADPDNPLRMWALINFVEQACALHHKTASCHEKDALDSAVIDFMSAAAAGPLHERLAMLPNTRFLAG
jgi:hypothetical protein